MKPRQTLKNYHNSNVPPYQQNLPSAIASSSAASSSTTSALRDIDLAKLGLTLDDMPNLQANSNLTNQDDLVKCLQAIYGKNSADILQKLPPLNDWPMQSISPPDFQRIGGGPVLSSSGGGGVGNNCGNINVNVRGYNNNTVNLSGHHQAAVNVNQFRTSNMQQTPQQQLSQQKSILSLHQNDLNNRRSNHTSTTSASFANLNTANSAPSTINNPTNIIASSSGATLDTSNLNSLNSIISKGGAVAGVPNIMDNLGANDSMFYDGSINATKDTSNNQQSLIKHQQLQRLLKATGSQLRPSSSTPPTITTTSTNISSHRSDMMPQRNINSNNMTSTQHPIPTQVPTISPPHTALSSVPKSLLNLAACSSTSPTSTNSSSLPTHSYFSSMVNQLNLKSGRNIDQTNLNSNNNVNSRSATKNSGGNYSDNLVDVFNQKSSGNLVNQNSLLQHSTRPTVTEASNNPNSSSSNRSSSKQLQWSLLSEDQSPRQLNPRAASNANINAVSHGPKTVSLSSNYKVATGSSTKEAFLADLQERAARAGVSIGEINKSIPPTNITNNTSTSSSTSQQNSIVISPNQSKDEIGRKEIESALSRVEARNDLSLLYPPMLLAASSQKQINALSAGLQGSEDTELFTKEVKKIILEECNIIYECKECNNLFRSLANLVKHKRTYCLEHNSDRMGIEMNKRSYTNATAPVDQSVTTIPLNEEVQLFCEAHSEPRTEESANQSNGLRSIEGRVMRQQEKKNSQEQDILKLEGQKANASLRDASHASLSRILQSQPKSRLSASRDNALIGTLNLTPSNSQLKSGYNGTKNMDCSTSDVNEQLIRNSSLAKTILNENVKKNPTQSLIALSKLFSNESDQPRSTNKRPAPKRNLEDCIQKVKRDKLLTEEDEERNLLLSNVSATVIKGSSTQIPQNKVTNSQVDGDMRNNTGAPKFNSPDVDYDSDKLEIDLDDRGHKNSFRRTKRRISTPASSTASSTPSSTRLNSSSALLKALTRPVDNRKSINNAAMPCDKESGDQVCGIDQDKESKSSSVDVEKSSTEPEVSLSPLFETYVCDICDSVFGDLMSLMDHTIERHPKEKMVYPCIFCSLSFIALENVCRHIVDIHKKPKAQVQRLKEVVRSRSYISSDFLACCDYPSSAVDLKDAVSEVDDKPIDEAIQELVEAEAAFESIIRSKEMKSNEKQPVEYEKAEESSNEESLSEESSDEDSSGDSSSSEGSPSDGSSSESSSSEDSSSLESSSEEARHSNSSKRISPTKDQKSPSLSGKSDSEASVESESLECESSPIQPTEATVESEDLDCGSSPTETTERVADNEGLDYKLSPVQAIEVASSNESSKQIAQKPSSSIKSAVETTPSSSNASGSGGIMKLKIQLKTTPDEKSKVYEIAR